MQNLKDSTIIPLIIIISAFLFIPFFGNVHLFDWDEINFAESAREMLVTGDYFHVQIDYREFWEKPPLFIWMQALSMKIFGVNEFAARFPNAIIGIITLALLYLIGSRLFDKRFGLLWVLAYAGSLLPHFYFRSGIIDPLFNLNMFLGVYFLFKYFDPAIERRERGLQNLILAGLFTGLAVLTKGPVGLLLPGSTWAVYYLINVKKQPFPWKEIILYLIATAFLSILWFGIEYIKNGPWFIQQFIKYQIRLLTTGDASHGGPIYYHFLVLLFGCFPASIFAFKGFKRNAAEDERQDQFRIWMVLLLIVTLVVFSVVKTKIVHYSSLAYFPITFLAALGVNRLIERNVKWRKFENIGLIAAGVLIGLLFVILPVFGLYIESFIPLIKDKFAAANMQAEVDWSHWTLIFGLFYIGAVIFSSALIRKRKTLKGFLGLTIGTIVLIYSSLIVFVPRIEAYTQRAAIEFYESLQGKDVYIEVLGFKSYAQLFYSRKRPEQSSAYKNIPKKRWKEWLLEGPIDKPAYFLAKFHHKWRNHPNVEVIGEKNGFVFLKREANHRNTETRRSPDSPNPG